MQLSKLILCAAALLCAHVHAADGVRVVVDTSALTLTVFDGSETVAVFDNIAIGRNGASYNKRHLDDKTPLGTFHISRVNYDSRFHLFFGFDYPTPAHAARALEAGLINRQTYRAIERAAKSGRPPPQNTPLGGYLGIHGIGNGELSVHKRFNWTHGCIAVTNRQIDKLDRWIGLGTTVVVR